MKKVAILACFFALILLAATSAFAATDESSWIPFTPAEVSAIYPLAFPPFVNDVYGARVNYIYGWNRNVYGFDFGLVNQAERTAGLQYGFIANIPGKMKGIGLSLFMNYSEDMIGFQWAVLGFNRSRDLTGIQIAYAANFANDADFYQYSLLFNSARKMTGYQSAMVNNADDMNGWQYGFVANRAGVMTGVQTALLFNGTDNLNGFQIGLINYAWDTEGFQLGLLNINKHRILPIINF